jgi:hypothetical protein
MNTPCSSAALVCAKAESVFLAGESGPVWRVVEGIVRLDCGANSLHQPVQLALPGDLIGIESLCGRDYQLSASAFTDCRLERVQLDQDRAREPLLQQALLQNQDRCQDMAALRTGTVSRRLVHLLHLMGFDWSSGSSAQRSNPDSVRQALPALREVAQLVDAKTETVCRALAQLLPPRSRKNRPVRAAPDWRADLHPSLAMA